MPAELPELLSARELCEKYPVPKVSADTWGHWLLKWRDAGLLQQGGHYLLQRREGAVRPVMCYRELCVLRLIRAQKKANNYFCQEICRLHGPAIAQYLKSLQTD